MAMWIRMKGLGLLALTAWLSLAGCGSSQSQQDLPPRDEVPRQGSVRVVNMLSDGPSITGILSGIVLGSIDFGQATALSKQLVAIYNLRLVYVNPEGDPIEVAPLQRIELTQEDEVSFYVLGTWAQPTLVRVDNVEIDFGVDPKKDDPLSKADVQVIHGATQSDAVDVYLTTFGADLAGETPLASLSFGEVDALETITPDTDYQLRVTPAGSTEVLFDSGEFAIPGFTRTVFVVQDYVGPGTSALRVARVTAAGSSTFPNESTEVTLRFANYVADLPAADLYFVDTANPPVIADVAFPTQSSRQTVTPGSRNVKVTATGTVTPFVVESTAALLPGFHYSLLAGGNDAANSAAVTLAVDDIRTIATEARLRVDHAAASAGTIDVYILPPGQPIDDVLPTFTSFALNGRRIAPLLPGTYDVTVTRSGSKVSLVGPEPITVDIGGLYTLAVTDATNGGAPVELRRLDDLAP